MDLPLQSHQLLGLGRANIILGKNGSGKSHLLKVIEQGLSSHKDLGIVRYVSPERAGLLQYDPNVENNIASNASWLADVRRQNQASQFRQQSTVQFRRLELLVLREIEQNAAIRADPKQTFETVVARINTLLDRVLIKRADLVFRIFDRTTGNSVDPTAVSSGEAELISLGIESLVFARDSVKDRLNVLLLDEPDVHLHPDLQVRLARFLVSLLADYPITLILATHSTAFLGAASPTDDFRVTFMKYGDTELRFEAVGDVLRRVLPAFGAHPLSNIFNESPVLLVEGDDDERIWQQAVRSSRDALRVYPVAVDSVDALGEYEIEVARIVESVYDKGVAYSLRDRDLSDNDLLSPVGPVRRLRLACRAAENLLLSDEVLSRVGIEWDELGSRITAWVSANTTHPHHAAMTAFLASGPDRRLADLKEIRNDLVGIMGSNKPWEVLVGQTIAALPRPIIAGPASGLAAYLGTEVCQELLASS